MDGRHRTGENRGMSHAGDRWDVVDHGVLAAVALVEHSFETTLAIQVIVAVEIIPTHLVNNDAHYEFGAVQASCHGLCAADECHDSQQCPSTCSKKMSFHDGSFLINDSTAAKIVQMSEMTKENLFFFAFPSAAYLI